MTYKNPKMPTAPINTFFYKCKAIGSIFLAFIFILFNCCESFATSAQKSAFRLQPVSRPDLLPSFVDVFSLTKDVPPPPPAPPTVRSRTANAVTICWGAMSTGIKKNNNALLGQSLSAKQPTHVDSWNLIMNRVSVYSGIKLQYTQVAKCHKRP